MANWLQQKKLESVYGRAKTTDSEHAMSQKMLILVDGKLDIFTAKTHALEFQHVRVREDVHNKWNVAGSEVFGKHTVLPKCPDPGYVGLLGHGLAPSEC